MPASCSPAGLASLLQWPSPAFAEDPPHRVGSLNYISGEVNYALGPDGQFRCAELVDRRFQSAYLPGHVGADGSTRSRPHPDRPQRHPDVERHPTRHAQPERRVDRGGAFHRAASICSFAISEVERASRSKSPAAPSGCCSPAPMTLRPRRLPTSRPGSSFRGQGTLRRRSCRCADRSGPGVASDWGVPGRRDDPKRRNSTEPDARKRRTCAIGGAGRGSGLVASYIGFGPLAADSRSEAVQPKPKSTANNTQPPPSDDFLSWVGTSNTNSYTAVTRHSFVEMTGYEELDPYGQWKTSDDYGAVWFPTSVAPEWAPSATAIGP